MVVARNVGATAYSANDLSACLVAYLPAMKTTRVEEDLMNPAERVRLRMQQWMHDTGVSQREFAAKMQKTQPWIQAILKGKNHVRLEDIDAIASAMSTTAPELLRAGKDRYVLELTPAELRVLQRMRHRTEVAAAVQTLMDSFGPRTQPNVAHLFGKPHRKRT